MRQKRTFVLLLVLLLSFGFTMMAQQRQIKGTVKDATGEAVIGLLW
jgi:hypothetical protein